VLETEPVASEMRRAPCTRSGHHAYLGGLLEHTLQVVRLARAVAPLYADELQPDLLVVGAFLHDVAKTEEIRADAAMTYTDRGNLVGHIASGAIWVQQKAEEVERETGEPFPAATLDLVQHLVLAHHGSLEFGSPKLPAIPEAIVLHYLDNLDAKVHMFARARDEDRDEAASFTAYARPLDVRVFKRSRHIPE
jgi:3'-5' exoribonuclease